MQDCSVTLGLEQSVLAFYHALLIIRSTFLKTKVHSSPETDDLYYAHSQSFSVKVVTLSEAKSNQNVKEVPKLF